MYKLSLLVLLLPLHGCNLLTQTEESLPVSVEPTAKYIAFSGGRYIMSSQEMLPTPKTVNKPKISTVELPTKHTQEAPKEELSINYAMAVYQLMPHQKKEISQLLQKTSLFYRYSVEGFADIVNNESREGRIVLANKRAKAVCDFIKANSHSTLCRVVDARSSIDSTTTERKSIIRIEHAD